MRKLNGREVKALFVFSIVVPIGLLTAFRMTGVLGEPPALQTVTTEPTGWQMDRPRKYILFNEFVRKIFTDDVASIEAELQIVCYKENLQDDTFLGGDGLELNLSVRAVLKAGLDGSFLVRFRPDDASFAWIRSDFQTRDNVTVTRWIGPSTSAQEASVSATTTNSPSCFSAIVWWVFKDQNTEVHRLEATFEFTYRGKSVYKKILIPMWLEMVRDVGNNFDTAKNTTAGEHRGSLDNVDYIDMYAVTLQKGQTINANLTPPVDANYDLYLYDSALPNPSLLRNSTQSGNAPEWIGWRTDVTGYFYIKVRQTYWATHNNEGVYILKIEIEG